MNLYVLRIFLQIFSASVLFLFLVSCSSHDEKSWFHEAETLIKSDIKKVTNQSDWSDFPSEKNSYLPSSSKILSNNRKPELHVGTGRFFDTSKINEKSTYENSEEGVTLNLVNVSIRQAAKAVLSDILKLNYTVDSKVKGQITIQTSAPIPPAALLETFEVILSSKGAAIVEANDLYKIIPESSIRSGILPIKSHLRSKNKPGIKTQIVPVRHISAIELNRVLAAFVPKDSIIKVDAERNLLILLGTDSELSMIRQAISVFDIDLMKGKSFGIFPLSNAAPITMAKELETIFENETSKPLNGLIKFIPNERLNALLVITLRKEYLSKVRNWLTRLDKGANQLERKLFVYSIQNRPATELAKILTDVFSGEVSSSNNTAVVAPGLQPITRTNNDNRDITTNNIASVAATPGKGPRFVVDETNNSLLIMATPSEYKRIKNILLRIDTFPNQVLLEAVIAEVTLNDELKFGLRWFFQKNNHSFSLSDAANGAIASAFPGFSYFFSAPDISLALNALNSITNVNVISSPSLMVLDNKTAVLQVGDQVPITTQTSVSTGAANAPVINSVELKDTGIILSITPRVSDSGRVILEIEQEVSNVVQTTSSGIDSPTIQQRKIKTTVAVQDGESLSLGGLIQERKNLNRSQVPIAGNIPLLGNAFKNKVNKVDRTELIIVIRPKVVRNLQEARSVTEEFRRSINLDLHPGRGRESDMRENVRRVLGR